MRCRIPFTFAAVLGAGIAASAAQAQPATTAPGEVGSYLCTDVRDDAGERVEAQMSLAPGGGGGGGLLPRAYVTWSALAGAQGFHLITYLSGERDEVPLHPRSISFHFPIGRRLSQRVRIEIERPSGNGVGYSGGEMMFASPYYRFRPARRGLNPGHEREVRSSALLDDLRVLMNGVEALDVSLVREGGPGELRSDRTLATGRISRAMLDRPRQAFLEARARLDLLAADHRNLCTPQPPDEPIIVAGGN